MRRKCGRLRLARGWRDCRPLHLCGARGAPPILDKRGLNFLGEREFFGKFDVFIMRFLSFRKRFQIFLMRDFQILPVRDGSAVQEDSQTLWNFARDVLKNRPEIIFPYFQANDGNSAALRIDLESDIERAVFLVGLCRTLVCLISFVGRRYAPTVNFCMFKFWHINFPWLKYKKGVGSCDWRGVGEIAGRHTGIGVPKNIPDPINARLCGIVSCPGHILSQSTLGGGHLRSSAARLRWCPFAGAPGHSPCRLYSTSLCAIPAMVDAITLRRT